MAERGAKPNVHPVRARVLKAISAFTSPLLPDDYLELINPLWSTREVRGRVEELNREAGEATTVLIRPGHAWPGHEPGQYLRIGFDVDGVRHWRAYSLTSDPGRPDGFISITPKLVEEGKVSPFLTRQMKPGCVVRLGGVEGTFKLLEQLCPDWTEREVFASGPGDLLDALTEHFEAHGDCDRLHMERFQPVIGGADGEGEGGTIRFTKSDKEAESDGSQPILVAGEEAGLELPFGCRQGICHTCIGKLCSGQIRDMRNGKVYGTDGEMIRTCISAPEGPIEIEL